MSQSIPPLYWRPWSLLIKNHLFASVGCRYTGRAGPLLMNLTSTDWNLRQSSSYKKKQAILSPGETLVSPWFLYGIISGLTKRFKNHVTINYVNDRYKANNKISNFRNNANFIHEIIARGLTTLHTFDSNVRAESADCGHCKSGDIWGESGETLGTRLTRHFLCVCTPFSWL